MYRPLALLRSLLILVSHKGNLGARGGGDGEYKVEVGKRHKGNLGGIDHYAYTPLESCKLEYPLVLAIQGWLLLGKDWPPDPTR